MKLHRTRHPGASRRRAIMLVDCLVYISLVTVILGVGTLAFFKCWDANKALRRNADDIVRALHAGEQWRADIRAASGPILETHDGDSVRLSIPRADGGVEYVLSGGQLRRQTVGGRNTLLLSGVVHSRMLADPRPHVTAWRWDLELSRTRRATVVKPLFTFEAVPVHLPGP